jgi:hypothetical protein
MPPDMYGFSFAHYPTDITTSLKTQNPLINKTGK